MLKAVAMVTSDLDPVLFIFLSFLSDETLPSADLTEVVMATQRLTGTRGTLGPVRSRTGSPSEPERHQGSFHASSTSLTS